MPLRSTNMRTGFALAAFVAGFLLAPAWGELLEGPLPAGLAAAAAWVAARALVALPRKLQNQDRPREA